MEEHEEHLKQKSLFNEGLTLFKQEKYQEGADILFKLAYAGHLESIEQLSYILLNQGDLKVVEELLDSYCDANNPTILFMKAKLTEASSSFDSDAYLRAANAGSASAALALAECFATRDAYLARKWLIRAEEIGHPNTQFYRDMLEIKPRDKQFLISVECDSNGVHLEINVYLYEADNFVSSFENLKSAIKFCVDESYGYRRSSLNLSKSGFEITFVDKDNNIIDSYSEMQMHVKVIPDQNSIKIAEGFSDFWFGELSDMEAAIEELLERDCSWDLVFFDSIPFPSRENSNSPESWFPPAQDDDSSSEIEATDFQFAGSIESVSGRILIIDPSYLEDLNSVTNDSKEFADFNSASIAEEIDTAEITINILSPRGWGAGLYCGKGFLNIFYLRDSGDSSRISALLVNSTATSKPLSDSSWMEEIIFSLGYELDAVSVDSGQLILSDVDFLKSFDSNESVPWDLEANAGKYSYMGASQITLSQDLGCFGKAKGFASNTGYGDGSYSLFALGNRDGEIIAVLINFLL